MILGICIVPLTLSLCLFQNLFHREKKKKKKVVFRSSERTKNRERRRRRILVLFTSSGNKRRVVEPATGNALLSSVFLFFQLKPPFPRFCFLFSFAVNS